jgi:hypothetical protein
LTARAALVVAAFALSGCGGSSDPVSPTPPIGTDEQSIDAVEERLQELSRRKDAARRAGDSEEVEELEQAIRAIEREQDAAVEEEFETNDPYDAITDEFPLHEPPLHVAQLMVTKGSHELVVRVKPKRFFCGRSAKQRLAAVRSYYAEARERMEAAGVRDFTMVVDGLRETGTVKPLARGAGGKVALTARGRGPGPC